jgi:signal peptidase I
MLIEAIKGVVGRGASFRFCASGWSMSPFIKNGDVLTIQPLTISPSTGDVVAFIHPVNGRLLVHRIVCVKNGAYEIKGDNVEYSDGLISHTDILGMVDMVERMNRRIYLGIGLEKFIIALLSRMHLLININRIIYSIIQLSRKIIPCR